MIQNINIKYGIYIFVILYLVLYYLLLCIYNIEDYCLINLLKPIPSVITLDSIFLALFIRYFWKIKLLYPWLIRIPNLNGTWRGTIVSSWTDGNGNKLDPISTILSIRQTFIKISCTMRTGEMVSHSCCEGFIVDPQEIAKIQLGYFYLSKPKPQCQSRSPMHYGAILFDLTNNNTVLIGSYWTQRKTTGEITLKFYSKEYTDMLPSDMDPHPMSTEK